MKQGQSIATEEKARGLDSIFQQQLSVYRRMSQAAYAPYVHIDLHAGSGFNDEVGVIGSPVLFCERANSIHPNYLMLCVEQNRQRVQELGNRLKNNPKAFPQYGDNAEFCRCVPEILFQHGVEPGQAVGSLLIDPNSFRGQIPWRELNDLLRTCGRLDAIFNYPGTAYTRNKRKLPDDFVSIEDLPKMLIKKHWLIREPIGPFKFTLCVGRNTDKLKIPNNLGKRPFVQWDSQSGKRFRLMANHSKKELEMIPCTGQLEFSFG